MATSTAIPRFLLPQISWKGPVFPSQAFRRPPFRPQFPSPFHHRAVTTLRQRKQLSHIRPSIIAIHRQLNPYIFQRLNGASRVLSTTQARGRDHHFDTLKFVQRLKDEGFSEEQSKAMMLVLSDVIEESIQNLTRTMVLREGTLSLSLSLRYTCYQYGSRLETLEPAQEV